MFGVKYFTFGFFFLFTLVFKILANSKIKPPENCGVSPQLILKIFGFYLYI